jgi:ligand-binding sensor domain-containing protein
MIQGQYIKLFIIILFNLWSALLYSQKNGQFIYETKEVDLPFTVTQYSSKHGLPQNQVLRMLERPDGNLLLSTANGIVSFDGEKFDPLKNDAKHRNQLFHNLFRDQESGVLLGTTLTGDLYQLEPVFKKVFTSVASTIHKDKIYSLTKDGFLYQASINDLHFSKIASLKKLEAYQIIYDNKKLYITSFEGLYQFDLQTKKLRTLFKKPVYKVEIHNEFAFLMTHKTLEKINLKSSDVKTIYTNHLSDYYNYDLEVISSSECYVGSNYGLIHVKDSGTSIYDKASKLPSNNIHSLFFSRKNKCLFVGTAQKGLLKLDFKKAFSITRPNEFRLNSLSSIVKYDNKILTSGSSGKIFEISDRDSARVYLKTNYFLACLAYIDDYLAVGTWGAGFSVYKEGKEVKNYQQKTTIKNPYVHAIFQDSKKQIWIGTSSGISMGKTIEHITPFAELNSSVICFTELKNNTICVGTNNGIYFIKHNKIIKKIGRKEGFFGKEVRSFYEDRDGRLWIGTYNGGLFCYANNTFQSINQKANCNLPKDIFCIAKSSDNMLYFTGNLGLYAVHEEKLVDFYENKRDILIPFKFGEEAGIYNTEFNGGFQNNYLYYQNQFYFPSIEGVTIFKPKYVRKVHTDLLIKKIVVNNQITPTNLVVFPPSTHSISFEFSKANFQNCNQVLYQYSLTKNGKKDRWSSLLIENSINFSLLSHGDYLLKIRALDSYNNDKNELAIYRFQILPFYYQTNYFYVFVALIFIFIGGILVKLRSQNKEKKQAARIQTNQLISELKIAAIQARMNPHFIFNSLNSIKYFLITNHKERAEKILDDFSKLLRKFLQYSDYQFIELGEELDLLKLYVSIEQERFNHSFQFEVEIENIAMNEKIPTMLIQPFVENAIKHGVSNVSHPGLIRLSIRKENESLFIKISDNGIGFFSSEKNKNPNHISNGIKLVEGKINIMREKYHVYIDLKIQSKVNEGTEIIINISA